MKNQSRSKGNANKKKGAKTILFSALIVILLTCFIVGFCLLIYVISFKNGDVAIDLDSYKNNQNQTSILYAKNSDNSLTEIGRLHGEENRIWVNLDGIPDDLQKAFIALED